MIKNKLKEIKARYKEHYGAVFFDIKIKNLDGRIVLDGVVLSERQKKEAFFAVQEILKGIVVKNEIKVLSEPNEKLEIGWGIIKSSIVDIWGKFPIKKLTEHDRASQAVKGDIVRMLAKKGSYFLAQTQDMAIGWIEKRKISARGGKKWKNMKKAKFNETLNAGLTKNIRKKFIAFLENYLYAPYVWGGTTELGIDCSGLVQKFYWEIFGILLPRHSSDQSVCGKKIIIEKAQFGDLVFLREKTKKYSHIGIIIEINQKAIPSTRDKNQKIGDILILNARWEKGGVVIQSAEEILKDYNLISVIRIINI